MTHAADEMPFAVDAGALNVRDFGAVGDGVHDDTAAFRSALQQPADAAEHWHVRIVQIPAGTYVVSDTLAARRPDGNYNAGAVLIGAGPERTTIRLAEASPGFQDPAHPRAVIYTTGKGFAQAPKGGYALRGEGNDGFANAVESLSIDVGEHNPGAIGIDYLANNEGVIRSVIVRGAGRTGISMTRPWVGPALLSGVSVIGFDIGVDVASLNYSVTMDHLRLSGQRLIGLRNTDNLVALHDLEIRVASATVVPLVNASPAGEIVIDGGVIRGRVAVAATNAGGLYVRDLEVAGADTFLSTRAGPGAVVDGVFTGDRRVGPASPPWALHGTAAPAEDPEPSRTWANVAAFGAADGPIGQPGVDATGAIRRALASGARTIYLPFGVYEVRGNIEIPAGVRRIVGMNSTVRWVPTGADRAIDDPAKGLFRTHNGAAPLQLERLVFSCPSGHHTAVEHVGSAALVLRDVVGMGVIFQRDAEGGPLYIENVSGGFLLRIAGTAPVWGRQVDTEGGGARGGTGSVRITNDGAPLWLLGLKSEGDNTLVASSGGATTDILGMLFMALRQATVPLLTSVDSRVDATGVEVAFKPESRYAVILRETASGTERLVRSDGLPGRPKTEGILVPYVGTELQ
jgi:hypothetical protein